MTPVQMRAEVLSADDFPLQQPPPFRMLKRALEIIGYPQPSRANRWPPSP